MARDRKDKVTMHVRWPRLNAASIQVPRAHNPYDAEEEPSALAWNTHVQPQPHPGEWPGTISYVTLGDLVGLGMVAEYAFPMQGSYWPNEPPVLPQDGYVWYDYGPIGRGMDLWKVVPANLRPSAEEQKAALELHRANFAGGKLPEGLVEALAKHGLSVDQHWLSNHVQRVFLGWITLAIVGWIIHHTIRTRCPRQLRLSGQRK